MVSTVLENGTRSPFEVRTESSCGVHTTLKTLNPREEFKLVRSSSDTYVLHWVVMNSNHLISFSSDELIDFDRITIVNDGPVYRKVTNPRYKSNSMPNARSRYDESEEGPTMCRPPFRKNLKRFYNSFLGRGSDILTEESEHDSPHLHHPNRLHSI